MPAGGGAVEATEEQLEGAAAVSAGAKAGVPLDLHRQNLPQSDKKGSFSSWDDSKRHVRVKTGANWHLAVTFSGDAAHSDVDWSTLLPVPKSANLTGAVDGEKRVVQLSSRRQFDVYDESHASDDKTTQWIRPLDGLTTHCTAMQCTENCSNSSSKAIAVVCFLMLACVFLAPFVANYLVIKKGAIFSRLIITVPDEMRDLYSDRKRSLRNLLIGVVLAEGALLLITLSILSFFLPGTSLDEGIFFLVALPLFICYCATCISFIFVQYDIRRYTRCVAVFVCTSSIVCGSFAIVVAPSALTTIGCIIASSLIPQTALLAVPLALLMLCVIVQAVRLHRVTSRAETASASWPPLSYRHAAAHRRPRPKPAVESAATRDAASVVVEA
ncbi:MAG: hypothetical protein MHM6MM_002433 [Cercozoa sp. M6MM]